MLIQEGRYGDDAGAKAKAAARWVDAVNRVGDFGTWQYLVVTDPPALIRALDDLLQVAPPAFGLASHPIL